MQQQGILLTTLNAKYIHMNLAIRLLYELNKTDERLSWKEFTIKEDQQEIALYCSNYEVVCFSCYIWNITQTLAVADLIKTINPTTKILLGGPEVTYDWHDVIQLSSIDYIVVGEGEISFAQFLQQYPLVENVANIVSKQNGEIQYHQHPANFDLELYANTNPYQNDDVTTLLNRVLYIETSRGCPYKCEFCLASLDNRVRYLPMEHIKSNLLFLMTYGKTIKFLDRTFNVKKDFTLEIFQFILDHAQPDNVFQFEITADILHPAIMQFIKDKVPKGMFRFEIGIQTVNQKANLEVSRKQNFEKTKEVILQLKDHVEMHLDLIVGLPLDYWEDTKHSFEEVFKLYPPELQLGFLKFLKGTPVRDKYEQYGYVFDPVAPYQIIKSNYLSEQELADIVKLEHALEIYWNKKRLVHTLTYVTANYSIFDFLLGLGKYFEQRSSFFSYTAMDIYNIANDFIQVNFANDSILHQLLAIDYYLQHKIKPAEKFVQEIDKKEKFSLLEQLKLPHQKLRYVVISIDFNYPYFISNNIIETQPQLLVIEYTGTTKPAVKAVVDSLKLSLINL
jgi:anaerobic magnesium-protoporphyrin IX monomethyl ester cyclase